MTDIALPSLRADLRFGLLEGRPVAEDPLTGRRVALGSAGEHLANALGEATSARRVLAELDRQGIGLSPEGLRRRLQHLAVNGLLEGARADALRAAAAPDPERDLTVPLEYEPGLRHACQACGSCCSATDVGPIPDRVAERILAHDWSEDLPDLADPADLFRTVEHEGQTARLTAMAADRCVFLGPDRLCLVHKRLGVEAKPTPCRQFPYVFAHEGDRITVSLQMECRAYWKAKQAAPPPQTIEEDLRALLGIGAPVHQVPPAVPLDPGLVVPRADYVALERAIIDGVRAAEAGASSVGDLFQGFASAAEQALRALTAPIEADEAFLDAERWRVAFPDREWPLAEESNLSHDLDRFAQEVDAFAGEASRVASERGLSWLAERFGMLQAAARRLGTEEFPGPHDEAVRAIMADVIVSGLFGKETIRRMNTVRAGLALVGLRAALTWAGAQARARMACRVRVHRQDVIDSMVTIGKMLRERAVLDFCNQLKPLLISLFISNLGVLGPMSAPRLDAPGGIG